MPDTAVLVHASGRDYGDLRERLESEGLRVSDAFSAIAALALVRLSRPKLLISEQGLPDMSGGELCRRATRFYNTPTLLLGTPDEEDGHQMSCANSLPPPFTCDDVMGQIRRLLDTDARPEASAAMGTGRILVLGDMSLNLKTNQVTLGDEEIKLAPTQVNLLRILIERSPRVTSPAALVQRLWPRGTYDGSSLADVVMSLRTVLESHPSDPQRIVYVDDYGYRLVAVQPDPREGSVYGSGGIR